MMLRPLLSGVMLLAAVLGSAAPVRAQDAGVESMASAPFPNFETGPVRALLLSADGQELAVLNAPDHRVELYATGVDRAGVPHLQYRGAVFTGLEPVSMTAHPTRPHTLFVANLLSDSVSVVDTQLLAVTATIKAGDEPQDVLVFGDRLYVATARSAPPTGVTTLGDFTQNAVVVAQASAPYDVLARIEVPGHKPRALAAADGAVWVIPQNSGNHTTVLDASQTEVLGIDQLDLDAHDLPFALNDALALPVLSTVQFINNNFGVFGWEIPRPGRIVLDDEYPGLTPVLADRDVIGIDPATLTVLPQSTTGVGSTLLAVARHPDTGTLWIAAQAARNRTRFEPVIAGAAIENRIVIAPPGQPVAQVVSLAPPTTAVEHAQPVALAFSSGAAGSLAFAACLGDDTVVVLDGASGAVLQELATGPLPSGLAVDDARSLLYVFTRGNHQVQAYAIGAAPAPALTPVGRRRPLAVDPEPQAVAIGRRHLYDARTETGAGTGNFSCASCHVFGHNDQLGWDLGNPQGGLGYFYTDLMTGVLGFNNAKIAQKSSLMTHPMKGPMTTQSLRGLDTSGATPLHWRGDRRFFQMFRGAFQGLLGGAGIEPAAMQEFAGFVRSLAYPPNPYQPKTREYVDDEATGRDLFGMNPLVPGKEYNSAIPGNVTCISCHKGDFTGGSDFTGSQPTVNFDGENQLFNTAQLRGAYEKEFPGLTGFGVLHDGSLDDLVDFLNFVPVTGVEAFPLLDAQERIQVARFVRAWDAGLSSLVGDQFTATALTYANGLYDWLDLAENQAALDPANVDLVGKGLLLAPPGAALPLGLRYGFNPVTQDYRYQFDNGRWFTRGALVSAIATGQLAVTFTCVPPGMGVRLGLDRDEDGIFDAIERATGTNADSADTDRDGYADSVELLAGGNPLAFDASLPGDTQAPTLLAAAPQDVFTDTATLHAVADEPATLLVELGTAPGDFSLLQVEDDALRSEHDVVLSGLPAGTTLFWRATARDRNGNTGTAEGEFLTAPPLLHVADVTLELEGTDPYTVTARVTVVDHTGATVNDAPVRGLWAGDIGTADFFPLERTDAAGVAVFTVGPYTPAAPTTLTFSPAYVGTNVNADAFFIGLGGSTPTFFYNASANVVSYATLAVP